MKICLNRFDIFEWTQLQLALISLIILQSIFNASKQQMSQIFCLKKQKTIKNPLVNIHYCIVY